MKSTVVVGRIEKRQMVELAIAEELVEFDVPEGWMTDARVAEHNRFVEEERVIRFRTLTDPMTSRSAVL